MKVSEVREMSKEQSLEELARLYRKESALRMKIAMREAKNTAEIGKVKKTIARILTVLKEKEQEQVKQEEVSSGS